MPSPPDFGLLQDETPEDGGIDAESVQLERLSLENAQLEEALSNLEQDRELRRIFSYRLFWLVVAWLTVVISIAVVDAASSDKTFAIPIEALLVMLGSSTGTIAGLFVFVAKYLFPSRDRA